MANVVHVLLLPAAVLANFERLKDHLDQLASYGGYEFQNYTLTLGTAEAGDLFRYENSGMTINTPQLLGSGSKWPAATALLAMIHGAGADLDAPISKYLDYWTTNESDPRSQVTMRHFLSMTSGMVTDGSDSSLFRQDGKKRQKYANNHPGQAFLYTCNDTHYECMKQVYEDSPAFCPPGKYFSYATMTFNFVAAAMEAVHQKKIGDLLVEYLIAPVGMEAMWVPYDKPVLGFNLYSSAKEMSKFLQAALGKRILPKFLHDEQERIEETFEMYSTTNLGYGPYGMGMWGHCPGMGFRAWPEDCQLARRRSHPGCFGYYPVIDRRDGFYYNFLPRYTC